MQAGELSSSPGSAQERRKRSSGGRRGCCSGQLSKQCRVSLRWENNGRWCGQERDRLAMEKTWDLGPGVRTEHGGWTGWALGPLQPGPVHLGQLGCLRAPLALAFTAAARQEGVSRQALRVDRSLAGYWRKTLNVAACACVSQPRRVLLLSSLLLLLLMEHSVVPAFSDHSLSAASSFRKERPTNRAARTREASTPRHRRSI